MPLGQHAQQFTTELSFLLRQVRGFRDGLQFKQRVSKPVPPFFETDAAEDVVFRDRLQDRVDGRQVGRDLVVLELSDHGDTCWRAGPQPRVMRMFFDADRADSFVIPEPSGALPYTKLTRCSWSSSSDTCSARACSNRRSSSGRGGAGLRADFLGAMVVLLHMGAQTTPLFPALLSMFPRRHSSIEQIPPVTAVAA